MFPRCGTEAVWLDCELADSLRLGVGRYGESVPLLLSSRTFRQKRTPPVSTGLRLLFRTSYARPPRRWRVWLIASPSPGCVSQAAARACAGLPCHEHRQRLNGTRRRGYVCSERLKQTSSFREKQERSCIARRCSAYRCDRVVDQTIERLSMLHAQIAGGPPPRVAGPRQLPSLRQVKGRERVVVCVHKPKPYTD
jgi:hypothetical protein